MMQALFGFPRRTQENESLSCAVQADALPIRILSHNIRYATSSPSKNERLWKDRFPLIYNELAYHTRFLDGGSIEQNGASFICLQEVLHSQLDDLLHALNHSNESLEGGALPNGPFWSYIGVAREDGHRKGEYSPILYPTRSFTLLHFETTWLSPTPDKPSKGWDAGSERILTTGVFEHKTTKQRLAAFNTHLDNAGSEARQKGVGVILDVIDRIRTEWYPATGVGNTDLSGLSFFLAGDFNSFPTQEAYQAVLASGKMVDSHEAIAKSARYGDEVTFTGFQPDTDADKDEIGRIDYIWFGPKSVEEESKLAEETALIGDWRIEGYAVSPNCFDDGVFGSDHRCVIADAVLRRGQSQIKL